MLSKTDRKFLRRLFERYIERQLEASIYENVEELKLDFFVCPTPTNILTFDPKEVEKVITELEKKGYKVNVQSPQRFLESPQISSQNITIFLN